MNKPLNRYYINFVFSEKQEMIFFNEHIWRNDRPSFRQLIKNKITDLKDLLDWTQLNSMLMPKCIGMYQASVEYKELPNGEYKLIVLSCEPLCPIYQDKEEYDSGWIEGTPGPYRVLECLTPIICDKEDYSDEEWKLLTRIFSPCRQVSRIQLNIQTIESFSDDEYLAQTKS